MTDLEQSQQFYQDVLGLIPVERPFSFPGAWYQIGPQQLHLIEGSETQAEQADNDQWGRNPHVAFGITNLEHVQRQLEARDLPFRMSASGRAALFTRDPDGNIIELTEIQAMS